MAKIVKLSELSKKEREKILQETQDEVTERRSKIENQISFKSNNRTTNNETTQTRLQSSNSKNRIGKYTTDNNFFKTNNTTQSNNISNKSTTNQRKIVLPNRENIKNIQENDSNNYFTNMNPNKTFEKKQTLGLPKVQEIRKSVNNIALNSTPAKIIKNIGYGAVNGLISLGEQIKRVNESNNEKRAEAFNKTTEKFNEAREQKNKEKLPTIDEIYKKTLGNNENKSISEIISGKDISKILSDTKNKNMQKMQDNIDTTDNAISKKLVELSGSLGQQLPGLLPGIGSTYFLGSAAGNYYDDAIQRGMSEDEAMKYAAIMGTSEGLSEVIGGKLTKAVGKNILKGNTKNALKSFGLDIAENFAEEAVMEPLSEATATLTGGEETANWNSIGKRMLESGIDGALVSVIMGGSSAGIGSALNVINKVTTGKNITTSELNQAQRDVINNFENDQVKSKVQEAQQLVKEINNQSNLEQNQSNAQTILPTQEITKQENSTTQNIDNFIDESQYAKLDNVLANNQETLYNNTERESGINERYTRNIIERGDRLYKEQENSQNREYSWKEYNKWERSIKPISENNLTNNEKNSIKKAKSEYNKDVVLYDENNNDNIYSGGASQITENKIVISKQKAEIFGLDKMINHETVESDILHKDVARDILSPVINIITEDKNFNLQKSKFWEGQSGNTPSDSLIAKDIICDRFSEIKNGEKLDYDNVLSNATNSTIDMALSNYYKQVYGKELEQSSSFNLLNFPTSEQTMQRGKIKLRADEKIAKDTSISDLDAIKESSRQVSMPSLQTAQQTEQQLMSKQIDKSPTIDYIKRTRTKEKLSIKEIKDTLAQRFVNKGHYIDKLAKQTGNKNLTYLYDRTMNTFNEAQISIGDHQVNSKGEVVGDSLIDIFEPSTEAGLELEFEDYLLNKHNISRYAHEKGLYGDEISATDSSEIVARYEQQHPEFKEWAKKVNKYNDNNLKDLVSNGIVSQELYDKLKELYGDYVPTYRDIVDNISQYEDNKVGGNPIKRATQSDKSILSVKESMAEQTLIQKKAIRINNLGIELYKTLGKDSTVLEGITVDPIAMQTLTGDVVEKATDGSNVFTIFKDGEMIQFKISDELYTAFSKDTMLNKINNSKIAKAILTPIEKMSKAQRELLTTYSVGFAMNNPIKDFQDAIFNSKYSGARFVKNWTKALYNIGTNGSWYESYKNNGGTANTYFDYSKGILPTKTINPLKKFGNAIKGANEVIEQAPRLAEYISTIETGGSIDEALYNAAEITTNFKRGGDITKAVNKYGVNFLNASVQGLDKVFRNISGQNGWKGYANLLTKAALYQIIPSVLNGLLLKDDEDYEDLPEYTKDNYFLFKMKDGKFFRIPKGRLSSVVGGIARRSLETVEGKDVDWKSIVDTMANQLAPNNPLTDNVLAPIIQAKNNKSWFGGDIVSSRLQKLPAAEQSDENTDKFSKWLGEKLNISPKKINYVIDQYSGGIGDVILPMLTPQAENNILEDKFTTDSVMKNKNVSKYYSQLEELEKKKNSAYATDEDKLKYKYISNASKTMSDLYQQKREIQNSNLTDKEKKEQVRRVQETINELAEGTLKGLEEGIQISGNTADLSGTQYYKYNGEWTQLSEKDNEKTQNIKLSTFADYKNKLYKLTQEKKEDEESVKSSDKIKILLNSRYTTKEKEELYTNYIGSNDNLYKVMKNTGISIDEYLKYKTQEFESDKKDDGTTTGKTISGSKKKKVYNYVNNMNITYNQKLLLLGTQYSLTSTEKVTLANYINSINISKKEKLEMYDKIQGFTVYKDGRVKWK